MDKVSQLYDQLDKYMRLVDRLRETLYWYAEPHGSGICISPCCIDNGNRARTALNFLGNTSRRNEPNAETEGWDANGSPISDPVRKEGVEL
jgi:hypothetical protein